MTEKGKILITTAIDYANDIIHIGQAYEKILADSYARYKRICNDAEKIFFVTGTDEHGATNQKAAQKRGVPTEDHVREISQQDRDQIDSLNIGYDRFIRTTDNDHKKFASDFFQKSYDNGDIYKGKYEGLYCEGCEAYKTLTELNENRQCPLHPTREIQKYDEENYFFKWKKYEGFLKEIIESNTLKIKPEGKRKEMLAFLDNGLEDIPVTRPKFKLPWGITAPIDKEQVIYVWFDALINYVTAAEPKGFWDDNTEIVHFIGKDVARWHTLLWPAMLKSASYRLPDVVYVHGFINLEGKKISKSRGNVIRPSELVERYETDAVRYYFLRYGPITEDVDISIKHFEEVYNGELANGLGNTVARIAKLAENSGLEFNLREKDNVPFDAETRKYFDDFRVDLAIQIIWKRLSDLDKHINENEPWAVEDKKKLKKILQYEVDEIRKVAFLMEPFIPETSKKIQKQFGSKKIKSEPSLFPRI